MTEKAGKSPWFYASLIAPFVAVIGVVLSLMPQYFMTGQDVEKLTLVLGIFFSEIVMVVAALGLLAYLKMKQKTPTNIRIARLNGALLVSGFFTGLWLFLG
ncbi:MAG: hypothetical protein GY696_05840 [Gammaproteobacteria bacterium]|nr:hypothetical protein [Gammaproteobacteria bacterium]